MVARYQPRAFPVQVTVDFVAEHEVRSDGSECPTSSSGYSKNGVRYNGRRPILYDSYDELRQQPTGPALPHRAMDITCALGSFVVSPADGQVPVSLLVNGQRHPGAGQSPKGGNYCFVRDVDGYTHYFAHMLTAARVLPGQRVSAGQILGRCGRTGNAAGGCAHLHYAVTDPRGQKLNPYTDLLALYEADGWKRSSSGGWWLAGLAAVGAALGLHLRRRRRRR